MIHFYKVSFEVEKVEQFIEWYLVFQKTYNYMYVFLVLHYSADGI